MTEQTQDNTDNTQRSRMSRRGFLKVLGIGVGGLAVGAVVAGPTIVKEARLAINQAFLNGSLPPPAGPESPLIWFEISPENHATLYMPKIEMGQGIHTTLAQIAAEELDLDWETITVKTPDTASGFDPELVFTFGSTSTVALYQPTREIAATMRKMLVDEAAQQLDTPSDSLTISNSVISSQTDPSISKTFGEVIADKADEWVIPDETIALKPNEDFKYIGKPLQRVDFHDKLTGRAVYGYDARMDGMLYGAVARPPRIGARLKSASVGTADAQPGVVEVVILDNFAGIVAEHRSQAYAALAFLELEWAGGTTVNQQDILDIVTVQRDGGTLIQRAGDVPSNINNGKQITSEYRSPMAVHAHLEPQAALVAVDDNGVTVQVSTQHPGMVQEAIANALAIEPEQVSVTPTYLGGGFGRKFGSDVGVEAAYLSRAVGRPVHVGWNRPEDMRYGQFRPPVHNVLTASIDNNEVTAVEHQLASGDVFFFIGSEDGPTFFERVLGADPLAAFGSQLIYNFPHRQVIYHRTDIPIPTAFWRGLGTLPNTFAVEAFIDELAHETNTNPMDFRMKYLPEGELGERCKAVLERIGELSDWYGDTADGHGKGLALSYDRGTVSALVVDCSIENGNVRTHHAWCVADAGYVVNPNGAEAQVQGTIVMALSSVYHEAITIEDGMITNENFNNYPLIRMQNVPEITVDFINSGDTPVGGMGEPVIGTVPAAISNALFALNGTRIRELPLTL
jgi:isoquinoline 1-oxidoreductase beta subunit